MRINSGRLRGRKLNFPELEGLRPSLGRTRETLFNWLRPMLRNASCLDLFAGSGVLGIEALSIGAREVTLVEQNPIAAKHLEATISSLALREMCLLNVGDARHYLRKRTEPFDVIFIDPPFAQAKLLEEVVSLICERALFNEFIYLEFNQQQEAEVAALLDAHNLPLTKSTQAGTTRSWLIAPRQAQG